MITKGITEINGTQFVEDLVRLSGKTYAELSTEACRSRGYFSVVKTHTTYRMPSVLFNTFCERYGLEKEAYYIDPPKEASPSNLAELLDALYAIREVCRTLEVQSILIVEGVKTCNDNLTKLIEMWE